MQRSFHICATHSSRPGQAFISPPWKGTVLHITVSQKTGADCANLRWRMGKLLLQLSMIEVCRPNFHSSERQPSMMTFTILNFICVAAVRVVLEGVRALVSTGSATVLNSTQYRQSFSLPQNTTLDRQYLRNGRKDRILCILTKRLKDSWAKGLPDDICWMIARYLVRECAVITAQEFAEKDNADESVIDLSLDVYVRYTMIDGIRYIRSLRNSAPSSPNLEKPLLLRVQDSSDIRNLYIGEDHLGIREVQVFSSSKSKLRVPGLWWRQLSEAICISKIRTRSDGLKLRDLVDSRQQNLPAPPRIYWPLPKPPVTIVNLTNLHTPPTSLSDLRMSSFECNAAHTTGYSIATDGLGIATVHTHNQKLDLPLYEEVDNHFGWSMVWIYMPIDEDEYITEICRRFEPGRYKPDSLGLTFTTNRQRATLFGSYWPLPSSNHQHQFDRIYTPARAPSRIYFNEWDSPSMENKIKFLGFESPPEPISRPYPTSLVPISPSPQTTYNDLWFYSLCSLENVIKITLCIDKASFHRPIVGMLLNYSDKHRACVGQFRFDWMLKPIEVTQAEELYIGIKRTPKRYPYVADINIHSANDCNSTSWLNVPWKGTLEWGFSHRQCKLSYKSNEEHS